MERPAIDVRGRVVVITGAARGLGRAHTEGFLREGAAVVASDRSWSGAEEFRDQLNANSSALVTEMDVRDQSQVDGAFEQVIKRFGTVDVLINNAGMRQRDLYPPTGRSTVLAGSVTDWERMYAVNVFGTLRVTQRFLAPMLERRRGSVVNVSSNGTVLNAAGKGVWSALRPNSREQPYMSSKSALLNMTLYLADEVREYNIAVNAFYPGHTRTTGSNEQEAARRAQGTRGPIPLEPEHAVPLMLFLARQDAGGESGKVWDAVAWNEEHGYGGPDAWRRPSD
jgi:NAD(P)-dependent dehydrogenase (short-subunit alcohol dehydrogenase family)